MLAMLYPGVDTRDHFHEDHIFPRSLLRSRSLPCRGSGCRGPASEVAE